MKGSCGYPTLQRSASVLTKIDMVCGGLGCCTLNQPGTVSGMNATRALKSNPDN